MKQYQITREITITPTPVEIARVFWEMNSDEQVAFLNELGEHMDRNGHKALMQMQYITDTGWLTSKGRYVMQLMGEYADKEPKQSL